MSVIPTIETVRTFMYFVDFVHWIVFSHPEEELKELWSWKTPHSPRYCFAYFFREWQIKASLL